MEFRTKNSAWSTFTFVILVCSVCVSPASCVVDDRCCACKAVALELEESLANERPRNHNLDFRHRLDSKGQRKGKVIDYRVCELRVVDLLDGLCAKMKPYVPNKVDGRECWVKVESGVPYSPEMAFNRQATGLNSRAIVEFCGRLLETTEEELTKKIQVGEVATGDVERVLCQELSKSCKESSKTTPLAEDMESDKNDKVVTEHLIKEEAEVTAKDIAADARDTTSMGSDGEL